MGVYVSAVLCCMGVCLSAVLCVCKCCVRASVCSPANLDHHHHCVRAQVVVIDCKNHLMGRLASVIAKEILSGQKIVNLREHNITQPKSSNNPHSPPFLNVP